MNALDYVLYQDHNLRRKYRFSLGSFGGLTPLGELHNSDLEMRSARNMYSLLYSLSLKLKEHSQTYGAYFAHYNLYYQYFISLLVHTKNCSRFTRSRLIYMYVSVTLALTFYSASCTPRGP